MWRLGAGAEASKKQSIYPEVLWCSGMRAVVDRTHGPDRPAGKGNTAGHVRLVEVSTGGLRKLHIA